MSHGSRPGSEEGRWTQAIRTYDNHKMPVWSPPDFASSGHGRRETKKKADESRGRRPNQNQNHCGHNKGPQTPDVPKGVVPRIVICGNDLQIMVSISIARVQATMHYLTLWQHGTQQHKQKGQKHFERAFDGGSQYVFWLYIYFSSRTTR